MATFEDDVKEEAHTVIMFTGEVDNGVNFIDMTDPASLADLGGTGETTESYPEIKLSELGGPRGLATFSIGDNGFALVAAHVDDGLQIMTLFDGEVRAVSIPDDPDCSTEGCFEVLDGAHDVVTYSIGAFFFAAVTAFEEDSVVIYDVTNPYQPVKVAQVTDGMDGFDELDGPRASPLTPSAAASSWWWRPPWTMACR